MRRRAATRGPQRPAAGLVAPRGSPPRALGPVWPKTALSAAMVRSQTMCRMCPPPTAYPATMAITGLGIRRMWICAGGGREASGHAGAPHSLPSERRRRGDSAPGGWRSSSSGARRAWRSRTFSRGTPSDPTYPPCPRTDWSPPLQKASSPAPARNGERAGV